MLLVMYLLETVGLLRLLVYGVCRLTLCSSVEGIVQID